jgi:hypothetical protein
MPEVMVYSRKLSAGELNELEKDMKTRGLSREFAMTANGGTVVLGLDKEKMGRGGRLHGDLNLRPFYQLYWGSNEHTTFWQLTVVQGDKERMSASGAYPAVEEIESTPEDYKAPILSLEPSTPIHFDGQGDHIEFGSMKPKPRVQEEGLIMDFDLKPYGLRDGEMKG